MMDFIQFLDNIRLTYSVWSEAVCLLSLSHCLNCRLWRPGPAGPRPPDERPLQPGDGRPETWVGQLGLAALQPPGPLPLLPHHLGRCRHAGGPPAHQRFQGESLLFTVFRLQFFYLDGSHGRRWWSWLLSSSYQWRSEEIPMQNVSTGRNFLLSRFSPSFIERYLESSRKNVDQLSQ